MFWPITGLKYWVERYSKSMGSELATCVMWNPRTLRLYLGFVLQFWVLHGVGLSLLVLGAANPVEGLVTWSR
jgi:hypothetical protein